MKDSEFDKYVQYNSCISKGICSINPRTSALQRVLLIYIINLAKYAISLINNDNNDFVKKAFLNIISMSIINTAFTENSYIESIKILKQVCEIFKKNPETSNIINDEFLEIFKTADNITQVIRFGEKRLTQTQNNVPVVLQDMYKIIFVIIKNMCVNLLITEYYTHTIDNDIYKTILENLNLLLRTKDEQILKENIFSINKININSSLYLRELQEKEYGKQVEANISYSTTPSKALLVVGFNLKELESVLEEFKDTNIDIYTHDEMILAYTFPKFKKYKNLKGQYGEGCENCLLDFSTFPGPILLTKYALHNIENLYRGHLYSTDKVPPKGVIPIKNNEFSILINASNSTKGFKTGKKCDSIKIGFNFDIKIQEIKSKYKNGHYKQIIIISNDDIAHSQKDYFEKLIRYVRKDTLIISLAYNFYQENIIHIESCFDNISALRIFNEIKELCSNIAIFIPSCNRDSIPQMIYFSEHKNSIVFVGQCIPILLNPTLSKTLFSYFGINNMTTPKNDLDKILPN